MLYGRVTLGCHHSRLCSASLVALITMLTIADIDKYDKKC